MNILEYTGINDEKSEKRANFGPFIKISSLKPWLCIEYVHFLLHTCVVLR